MAKKAKNLTKLERRKLLNVIADFIEPLPKNKFSMNDFGIFQIWDDFTNAYRENEFNMPGMHNCNTAGCALGWAVSIPAIVTAGFGPKDFIAASEVGGYQFVIERAAEVFAIDEAVAATIFGPAQLGHRTAAQVAANLRKVAKTGKLPAGLKPKTNWL